MPEAVHSIAGLNNLTASEKLSYLKLIVPVRLLESFGINPHTLADAQGQLLAFWEGQPGQSDVEVSLYRQLTDEDPVVYFHLTDTLSQQIHILLAVINDPDSPRFDIDRLPDGISTHFGTVARNLPAEEAALQAGLAPGQIHRGLRVLSDATEAFEAFIQGLGHSLYFVEPLYYHNALVFERYGFAYQQGRRWMEDLHSRFSEGGDLRRRFDGSTPFRQPEAANTIRGRSWAIHDGILGQPFTGVVMYKRVGQAAGVMTFPGSKW